MRTTSREPDLDVLVVRFHLESGARREGALGLRLRDLDRRRSTAWLREKFSAEREQPLAPSLLDALVARAAGRGATSGDDHVFRTAVGRPISRRHYNTLFDRARPDLGWAQRTPVSGHALRHTAITAVARVAGYPVAQASAGHAPPSVTGSYMRVGIGEVAAAVAVHTDEAHPLCPPELAAPTPDDPDATARAGDRPDRPGPTAPSGAPDPWYYLMGKRAGVGVPMSSGAKARRWVSELESIGIPVGGVELRRYRAWEKRRLCAGLATWEALRFADEWLAPVRETWLAEAGDRRWEPSSRGGHGPDGCRSRDEIVGHVADTDGHVMHLLVDDGGARLVLRAHRCFKGSPDRAFDHTWIDADRLTREEISAGVPCRGCGRPFSGGPRWVPLRDRTPEQTAAIEAEDLEFGTAHPACRAGRWSLGDGGVHHCSRCCALPPLPEAAIASVARIFADARRRQDELERRWKAARPNSPTKAPLPSKGRSGPDVEGLRRQARAAGFRLVPIDE